MHFLAAAIGLLAWSATLPAASGQGAAAGSLQGRTINAHLAYETRARRDGKEFESRQVRVRDHHRT
jgi:acyl-CoA thioesterase